MQPVGDDLTEQQMAEAIGTAIRGTAGFCPGCGGAGYESNGGTAYMHHLDCEWG